MRVYETVLHGLTGQRFTSRMTINSSLSQRKERYQRLKCTKFDNANDYYLE